MFQYNHNEHYADLLLRHVPPHCQHALDIGCGNGGFARRLADRFDIAVTGIDRDQAIIKRAQAETFNPSIQFVEADFLRYPLDEQFDFISASASLHHMPFDQALKKMVSLLRPRGVPTRPADMSLREIRACVSSHLPDAYLRRLLLWRYLLTWQKPQDQTRFPESC